MAAKKAQAFLLDPAVVAGSEPVTFPGFPGRYVPGEAVEVSEVAAAGGVDVDELLKLAEEMELPLELVDVKHGSGPLPAIDNHLGSELAFALTPGDDAPTDDTVEHEDPEEPVAEPATEETEV